MKQSAALRLGAVALVFAAAAPSCWSAPAVPTLPQDWSAIVTSTIVENEGGSINGKEMCCETGNLGGCEIQYQSQSVQEYFDFTNKRMKLSSGAGLAGVVYDYTAQKMYQVTETGECQSYCPMQQQEMAALTVGQKPTYMGSAVGNKLCDGQATCDEWDSKMTILGVIPMGTMETYVYDPTGKPVVPIGQATQLTPFGKPGPNMTQSWAQFVAGTPAADNFMVKGNATCMINQQCSQQSSEVMAVPHFFGQPAGMEHIFAETIFGRPAVPKAPTNVGNKYKVGPPNFAQDWTAITEDITLIGQGYTKTGPNTFCCEIGEPGQCKVQYQHQAAKQYYDVTNQLLKNAAPDGSGVVYNFTAQMGYQVAANGSCIDYCPLAPVQGQQQALFPIGMDPNSTFMGSAAGNPNCQGESPCNEWQFQNKIPILNITMETDLWFTTVDSKGAGVPITYIQEMDPLGENLGNMTTVWHNFVAGTPPMKTFEIPNAATCPQAKNCGN